MYNRCGRGAEIHNRASGPPKTIKEKTLTNCKCDVNATKNVKILKG
jgi:hypothetical protein